MKYLRLFLILAIMLPAIPGLVYGQTEIDDGECVGGNCESLAGEAGEGTKQGSSFGLGVEGKAIGLYCGVKEVCVIAATAEDCETLGGAKIEASECKASANDTEQEKKAATPE